MKRYTAAVIAFMAALFFLAGCKVTESGIPYEIKDGVIVTEVPERPAGQENVLQLTCPPMDVVRIGFVGLGSRGAGAVKRMVQVPGIEVKALCDIEPDRVQNGQAYVLADGRPAAAEYSGEDGWKKLCERDDLDLVYIATDWVHHAPIGVYAMEQGKHVAIEVPSAMSLKEIWDLVNTSERTRKHCMQLENCVYDAFEMTTLNMAQQGLFGEVVHVEGSYIHNLVSFWLRYWHNWRMDYNHYNRGDHYPTHGLGPVCQVLNIHRGDKLDYLVSMDTDPFSFKDFVRALTSDDPETVESGDHTMTMIRTEKGKTIHIQHDVINPRPYSRMYQVTGTQGFANKYPREGYAFDHSFLSDDARKDLMKKYRHPIYQQLQQKASRVGGHGGMDYIMDYRLIYCLRNGLPLDMDVYDLAEWCCLTELTGLSITHHGMPVKVPDFTRGHCYDLDGLHFAK